jgi:uncharacterized protein
MEIKLSPTTNINVQLVMTGRGCIIGQSGSGKSFLVGVMAEELRKLGLPFCLVDTEGEFAPLKSYFKGIIVGGSRSDFGYDSNLSEVIEGSIKDNIPLMLDLSEEADKTGQAFKVLEKIYRIEEKLRIPYLVMIEEADKFVPQITHQKINIVEEIAVRGRKRGIGLMIVTQRPSSVSKNILSQCSYGFVGKLTIDNDLKAIKQLFSDSRKATKDIVALDAGEFMPFGIGPESDKFKVRMRIATGRGSTPLVELKGSGAIDAKQLISEIKNSEKMVTKRQNKTDRHIKALALKFTVNDAHVYARKVSRHQFGVFGKVVEQPESIKLTYIAAGLCKIRSPTKRAHEFEENTLMIDRDFKVVRIAGGINFESIGGISKPVKLSPVEARVLEEIRFRRKVDKRRLEGYEFADQAELSRVLRRLAGRKLITVHEKNIYANNYAKYLMHHSPELEDAYASERQIEGQSLSKDEAKMYITNLYPNSDLVGFSTVYIPVYEIILRNSNRVRIFRIDGIYGKELVGR